MASWLSVWFAFDIGEIVYFRGDTQPDVIYERVAVEFVGGVQRLYRLGRTRDELLSETLLTNELPNQPEIE